MIQEKKCVGTGKAIGAKACGKIVHVSRRKFGLCPGCYSGFLFDDERGKIIFKKAMIKSSVNVKKEKEALSKKETSALRLKLLTADQYRATILQPVINEIARHIDHGQPCIASGNFGKMNGGHYRSVGSNKTIALNLHNIHIQSFESNVHKSGDPIQYREGIIKIYGNEYFEFIDSLPGQKPLKLSKAEMIEIYSKAVKIRNELKKDLKQLSPLERIEARDKANKDLNIYEPEFSTFIRFCKCGQKAKFEFDPACSLKCWIEQFN